MRRADRLFRLVQHLRRRRLTTARQLAEALEVSERTVYRDVADLVASGVPVRGEAGVGYALPAGFELPPLMFNEEELEALALGLRVAQSWADPALADAARTALDKVEGALPQALRSRLTDAPLLAPGFHVPSDFTRTLARLRQAVRTRNKVHLTYLDADGARSERTVRPLGLAFWGKSWTLAAWCERRSDFRGFRVDRMLEARALDVRFELEPGRTLQDFIRQANAEDPSPRRRG